MNTYSKKAIWAFVLTVIPVADYVFAFLIGNADHSSNVPLISLVIGVSLGPIFSIVGLVLGIMSLKEIKSSNELKGKGLAIAAIILVVVTIIMIFSILQKFHSAWS